MKPTAEYSTSAVDYSNLELDSSAMESNGWMVSYLDIFILTAAMFASLVTLEHESNPADQSPIVAAEQSGLNSTMPALKGPAVEGPVVEGPVVESKRQHSAQVALTFPGFSNNSGDLIRHKHRLPMAENQWQNSTVIALQRHSFNDNIAIELDKGFAEISIGSAVLFDSSDASLMDQGANVLSELLAFLKEVEGTIIVQGHTDSSPIYSSIYRSNWELASARANNVVHFLVKNGLPRERLRAVSFADTQPIAPNDTATNRQLNRRVNIVLMSPALGD